MRYLVSIKGKRRELYFWEEEKTHTFFASQNNLDLERVSSVGYILYNPDTQKWILTGAISWSGDANVQMDKRRVLHYIKKNFEYDEELKSRLTLQWKCIQEKNAQIIKKNTFFDRFFKKSEKVRE